MIPSKGTMVRVRQAEVDDIGIRPPWMLGLVESHGAAFVTVRVIDHLHRPMYAVSIDHARLARQLEVLSPLEVLAEVARKADAQRRDDDERGRSHKEGVARYVRKSRPDSALRSQVLPCYSCGRDILDDDAAPCPMCRRCETEEDVDDLHDLLDEQEQHEAGG